jgi:hypothetical protein
MSPHAVIILFEGPDEALIASEAGNKVDDLFNGDLAVTVAEVDLEKMKGALL